MHDNSQTCYVTSIPDRIMSDLEFYHPEPFLTWVVDCAARVLSGYEEAHPDDLRLRHAVEALRGSIANPVAGTAATPSPKNAPTRKPKLPKRQPKLPTMPRLPTLQTLSSTP